MHRPAGDRLAFKAAWPRPRTRPSSEARENPQAAENELAEVHGNRTHPAHLPVNHNWI